MEIYTLKGLAQKEGVSYDFLRQLVVKISRGRNPVWRTYRLAKAGKGYWLATPANEDVRFYDGE